MNYDNIELGFIIALMAIVFVHLVTSILTILYTKLLINNTQELLKMLMARSLTEYATAQSIAHEEKTTEKGDDEDADIVLADSMDQDMFDKIIEKNNNIEEE